MNRGYETGNPRHTDAKNSRVYIHDFRPSVINCDSNDKHTLELGAAPTMHLTKFSFENDNFNEEKTLDRIVGSAEDGENI